MGDSLNDKKYNSIEKEETTYDKTKNFVRLAGGVYKATEPTYSDGDVAHLLFNSKGHLKVDTNISDVVDNSAHLVRIAEQDPIFNNFTSEVICDITNGTDGTYNFYTTGDTFNEVGTQLLIDGGSGTATVTVEATAQDDGTAPASSVYVDVTNARFGAANFTASNYLFDKDKVLGQAKWIKYKVVLDTGGANDADVKIMIKKKW